MIDKFRGAEAVYLGTGVQGILKSADGGGEWTPIGLEGDSIMALDVDPSDPDRIYAATKQGVYFLDQSFLADAS